MSGLYLMAYASQSGTYKYSMLLLPYFVFEEPILYLTVHFSPSFITAETRAGSEYWSKYHLKK